MDSEDSDGLTPRPAWILIFPFSRPSGGLGAGSFCLLMAVLMARSRPALLHPASTRGETEPGPGVVSSEREAMAASYLHGHAWSGLCVQTFVGSLRLLVFMFWGGNEDKFIFIVAFPCPILQLFLHFNIKTPSSAHVRSPAPRRVRD